MEKTQIHRNKLLLNKLADLFMQNRCELAEANTFDTCTNYQINLDNVNRGISTLQSFADKNISKNRVSNGGIAIYSCYGDPSFVALGMSLAPAILSNGNEIPILLYFPSILKTYSQLFAKIINESNLFPNISFVFSSKEFFETSLNSELYKTILVYGDDWIENYLPSAKKNKKTILFFGPGNNISVILDNENLDERANKIAYLSGIISGQAAICNKRCIISEDVDSEKFINLLKTEFSKLKTGNNPKTDFITPIKIPYLVKTADDYIKNSNAKEIWNYSISKMENAFLLSPSLIIEPDSDSDLWTKYNFIPTLSIKTAKNQDIENLINKTDYKMAVSLFGTNSISEKLKANLSKTHAFVFENSDFLDIISIESGYAGVWGGYGKSAFLFNPDKANEAIEGVFDLFNVFTKEKF